MKQQHYVKESFHDELVGEYELRPTLHLSIRKSESNLFLHVPQQAPLQLLPIADRVYCIGDLEDTITFLRNEQGMIDMLILQEEGSQVVARKRRLHV